MLFLTSEQLSYTNWTTDSYGKLVSQADPSIGYEGLNIYVDSLKILADFNPMPQSYSLYYTAKQGEPFSDNKVVLIDPATGVDTIQMHEMVYALRLDPCKTTGTTLARIAFSINDIPFKLSIARIIAMLIIWWGAVGLMALQQPADYGMQQAAESEKHAA